MSLAIVIPIYNGEAYLHNLIKMARTLKMLYNFNFYFVNDASFDNTSSILNKCEKEFFVIHNVKNIGIAQSREKGLKNAIKHTSNSHFTFLDCDDYFYLKSMAYVNEYMDIYKNRTIKYRVSDKVVKVKPNAPKKIRVKIKKNVPYIFSPNVYGIIICRKDVHNFLYPVKIYGYFEDGLITHPFLLKHYKKILYSDLAIIHYTKNEMSVTNRENATYLDDIFKSLKYLTIYSKGCARSSIAFVSLRELMLHIYLSYCNPEYSLSRQISKSKAFLMNNFSEKCLKSAYHALD